MATARRQGASLAPLKSCRVGVVGNGTLDFVASAIAATALRYGLAVETVTSRYDMALQDTLSADSPLYRDPLDFVLIALDWRSLPLRPKPGDSTAEQASIDAALEHIRTIRDAIHRHSGAIAIVQNLASPPETVFGSFDRALEGTLRHLIDAVNARLAAELRNSADKLFDVAGIAETVGLANWHCPGQWNLAKLPFDQNFLPLYADHACRILAAIRGLTRRCLILDLDNTLWGGVIGDDGLSGILLGQGDATGEAYQSFQRYILSLRDRGIVIAVCSKNEDATARLPFRSHPEMLLKEEHCAVFQANWEDKATNIEAIAKTLSLGLESLVFVDDNPFERNLVREKLPRVAVPEMPEDPAGYARTLSAAGYFEAVSFSEEDVKRASFYAGNAQRAVMEQQSGDIASYLAALEMQITFQPFDEVNRPRISQLINKSNQFNLTTRRYSELDVARMEDDPGVFTLQVRLSDKFGDNGMISVVICRHTAPEVWEIDTWLMSCRVLGRGVEEAVLQEVLKHAASRGVQKLRGAYIPTERNKLVEQHYPKLGFTLIRRDENGRTLWERNVAAAVTQPPPMLVRSFGFASLVTEAAQP
ncbi:MAG TPA: HAD-IIIC family phosphatase [Bradyrhizobium sp.]|nr:HAD-IIIC family phosphatase [Bradyrhizobium sp.]